MPKQAREICESGYYHVQLVIKSSPENLVIAFKRINIKYAIGYNKTYYGD